MGQGISKDDVQKMIDGQVVSKHDIQDMIHQNAPTEWTTTFPAKENSAFGYSAEKPCGETTTDTAFVFCGVEKNGEKTRSSDIVEIQSCKEPERKFTAQRQDLNVSIRACVNEFKTLDCTWRDDEKNAKTLSDVYGAVVLVIYQIKYLVLRI